MKRGSIITKTIFQIFMYLIELLGVSFAITCFIHFCVEPILSYIRFIEILSMSYAIYQILVAIILTNINDIAKDSYLMYISILKHCLLYLKHRDKSTKNNLLQKIEEVLEPKYIITSDVREACKKIESNLDKINEQIINAELIDAECSFELATLNWRYSFLLRWLKK